MTKTKSTEDVHDLMGLHPKHHEAPWPKRAAGQELEDTILSPENYAHVRRCVNGHKALVDWMHEACKLLLASGRSEEVEHVDKGHALWRGLAKGEDQ